jgi:hypothetical protein
MKALALISFVLAACVGTSSLPKARYKDAPPVTVVDDRRDTPKAPKARVYSRYLYQVRGNMVSPIKRALDVEPDRRALGTNALDEVPSSTWFTNRLGTRVVTPEELRMGPGDVGSPEPHLPWTIQSTKVGGANIGFIIKDARGEKFILKFDKKGYPETETAAGVITGRLLWGMGWNVPEDHIVYFRATDLVLAPDAKVKDVFGHARALKRRELEEMLALVDVQPDGRIRSLASRFLDGKPLGGHPAEGTRSDDPNDRIPHERRRDLRGSYAMFAWLDHVDIKEDNSLDMLVKDPSDPERAYVKHYQIDFGSALGTTARTNGNARVGHEYTFDIPSMFGSLATLGLRERTWEKRAFTQLRGVGLYDVAHYDPGSWKPLYAGYLPFHTADRVDKFWGSKILIQYTREQLRAAVDAGRLTDPKAAEYITDTLVARQRATARFWFERTSALDGFAFANGELCFDDLLRKHALSAAAATYTLAVFDEAGKQVTQHAPLLAKSARTCSSVTLEDYSIIRITTKRLGTAHDIYVHVARDAGPRVIGIYRP